MSFVRQIIVGVEMPSEQPWEVGAIAAPCRVAFQMAIQSALTSRVPVTLATVIPAAQSEWFGSPEDAARVVVQNRIAALDLLQKLAQEEWADANSSQLSCVVLTGEPWEELIRVAGNRPDSLLVCGTRDQGTLRRVVFGSTGLKLLRLSPGAVWLVKPRVDDNDSTDIVAATDGTSVGSDVLITAVKLAKSLNARLHVIHAVDAAQPTSELLQAAEAKIHEQLGTTDYRTLPFGVKVQIVQGKADQSILKTVEDVKADVLLLGTTSKTGVSGLLPGSTVERLLPELSCSLMALKPEGFRSMLPADFWSHANHR
jgi:nucleotide-binding universal stress UspA family protein